ncbi:MAG: TolC family protein [Rhodoferax sp.]|uniref:TolC family protein n=1 Tax=Rhodoferax sp. TaxID=50421 RepID=UPI0027306E30|nr:TolC family protein [Rhodoferax sp.]MDP1529258.1 TolC family protein [Rhodoferax sp.]
MKPILRSLLLCASLWPLSGHAATLDLPERPGAFWLQPDTLPLPVTPPATQTHAIRFASLAALTEHALRERPESRAAWLAIQAEAARLDAASAANWPTLTGQINFTRSQALSSSGASVPTLHRYGPSLSLAYVLVDFGARAASIDAQRYQLIASLLNNNRALQDAVAAVEAAYYAVLAARAQVTAQTQQEAALRASLDAVEVRLRGGLTARADQLRARAALSEAQLARQAAERDQAKAEAALKQAAGIAQAHTLVLDWETAPPATLDAATLLADLLAEAERQRPDLQALQAAAASARFEAERARAVRWPSLSLAANIGRTFFLEDERVPSTTYSVGVSLSVPLFDGGRLAAQARAAERDAERLQAEADSQRSQVALNVAEAYHDVRHAQAQREGVVVQFDSASESARAAEARYTAGIGSLLEWLTAQADLARARQAQVQADSDWLAAFSRLNHALGRLPIVSSANPP